ncbi:RNA polymerase [Streptomyces sp. XM4193]|uniref:sigma factor-like helix-turn-helix DNA-binding protein n=1 Tax=Streptomyces sp. XM4193 TaxID=2929782 RepID=UPI001FF98186|nr:sigma factor-like helix-turn-helix DNA-binding protein [Streptomyces sp. XM4193]MCK1795674.1 RNA polymerase [Streptomyces sp. XM4193]
MGDRGAAQERRTAEFGTFVAGAAGRLLHLGALLTTEPFGTAPPHRRSTDTHPPDSHPSDSDTADSDRSDSDTADSFDSHSSDSGTGPAYRATDPELLPAARKLLLHAMARTYAAWDSLRQEDPYDRTRRELVDRFSHTAHRHRRSRGGTLGPLAPHERVVLVLRLFEDVPQEQVAAMLGLSEERVAAVHERALETMHPLAVARFGRHPVRAHG